MISLKNFKDKMVMFVYCDPESPLSRMALNSVVQASSNTRQPVEIVAVCPSTTKESMAMLRKQVPGKYMICKSHAMDRSYGMVSYPHTIIIDETGVLRTNFEGYGQELATTVSNEISASGKRIREIGSKPEPQGAIINR
jgi:hypothetical protein